MSASGAPPLAFVAGLTHSGTTLLDFLLADHPRLVGLGEVRALIDPASARLWEDDRTCSCGTRLPECRFWGPAREAIRGLVEDGPVERYRAVGRVFSDVFGADRIPVDSSKTPKALDDALAAGYRPRVLHLVRDVRGWIVSMRGVDRREGRHGPGRRNRWYRAALWWYWNRKIERIVAGRGLPALALSYEGLCARPDETLATALRFLGLDPIEPGREEPESHVALGNPMRLEPGRREIRYDDRWRESSEWRLPYLLLPMVRRYNRRRVHGPPGGPDA